MGACPGVRCMRSFWKVPNRSYIVTYKLTPEGEYAIRNYGDSWKDIINVESGDVSNFGICLFPPSWEEGTCFDRMVKLV